MRRGSPADVSNWFRPLRRPDRLRDRNGRPPRGSPPRMDLFPAHLHGQLVPTLLAPASQGLATRFGGHARTKSMLVQALAIPRIVRGAHDDPTRVLSGNVWVHRLAWKNTPNPGPASTGQPSRGSRLTFPHSAPTLGPPRMGSGPGRRVHAFDHPEAFARNPLGEAPVPPSPTWCDQSDHLIRRSRVTSTIHRFASPTQWSSPPPKCGPRS